MSKIIVLEIPDKYQVPARIIFNDIKEKYPDIELRLSAKFDWWKRICSNTKPEEILPLVPSKKFIKSIDEYIEFYRHPKSIEERNIKE